MSRSTFLPAAVIAISALAGCAGGPEQPATAPVAEHDSPGEGRKPASGAWLEHRYGDWSAEHGSATERHFQQGEAFGQTEQLTQPTVRVMVNKDNDADVRSNPLLTSGGMRSRSRSARRGAPPSPSSASASSSSTEAISNSLARMPTAQSSGHSPRTFTRRCRMTRTRLNPRRAPHPTTPVRTANPSKERHCRARSGSGRSSAGGATTRPSMVVRGQHGCRTEHSSACRRAISTHAGWPR